MKENTKFYFGPNRKQYQNLSLGTIGLLEEYALRHAYNQMKYPWFTILDIQSWCNDECEKIELYIQEGIENNYLIMLNEKEADRLMSDPLHNCWLYE